MTFTASLRLILFWGSGHVIQFTYTLFMLVGWLWLASESGAPVPLTPRVALLMFSIALAAVFLTPVIYLAYGVTSGEHRSLLTWLMQFGGGLAILPVSLVVAHNALAAFAVLAAVSAVFQSRSADEARVSAACQMVISK